MGSGKPDVSYIISHRLALNSGCALSKFQGAAVPLEGVPTPETERLLRAWAGRMLGVREGEIGAESIEFATPVVYKASVDSGLVYVISASRLRADGDTDSMAAVVTVVPGAIVPLMTETTTESASSWGHGYHFIDAIDIEGDGSPELVFQVDGYETTSFQVFKFKEGNCEKIMDLMAWGC